MIKLDTNAKWLLIFSIATIGMFPKSVAQTTLNLDDPLNIFTTWYKKEDPYQQLPKGFLTTNELITTNGFQFKKYAIITEDGYILSLHRIITNNIAGFPILYLHGLTSASDSLLLQPKNISLAFLMADAGFDVWLPDMRGNCYCREHVSLKPSDPRFWQFSFHEGGIYDLPAFIDHILKVTGFPQLLFIGYSLGATVFLAMASIRPEYNQKIKSAILLAPVAYLPTGPEPISITLKTASNQRKDATFALLKSIGKYELLPRTAQRIQAISSLCGIGLTQDLCLDSFGRIFGEHRENINRLIFPEQISHLPAGTSLSTVCHFAEISQSRGEFRQYGNCTFGPKNKAALYPLQYITTPVYMYYGRNDKMNNEKTTKKVAQKLPNVKKVEAVSDPKFMHLDYIIGKNVYEVLNGALLLLIKSLARTG